LEFRGKAQMVTGAVLDNGESAFLDRLKYIETTTLTEIQVEKAVNLIKESVVVPATIVLVASLPGRITFWEIVPGGSST
jgi:hypothetical protein